MADLMQIDELQLYIGEPYVINDKIIITPPKIGQIIKHGEEAYYRMIHTLTAIPSDMKSQLDDLGLDYEEVGEFQLFMMMCSTLSPEETGIIFGDLNLSSLRRIQNPQNGQVVLYNRESGVVIDELIYERIANYLRKLHGLKKKVEHAANKYTKKVLIEEDRRNIQLNKGKPYKSFLRPLISSIKVRQAYTLDYIMNMGIDEFFDEVERIQIIHNADALLQGCYAGAIDMKKINKKELNWMRETV